MLPVFSSTAITANGNFCMITVPFPPIVLQGNPVSCPMLNQIAYYIAGGSATGTITFQELAPDHLTWLPLIAPAPVTLAATNSNGSFTGPFLGLRMTIANLAVSTVSIALLKGTVVSG